MKTIYSISRYVLVLILMMMGMQQLQAQDAFYIYRNDGDFNGFFFDEVIRMSYSKTDLEGEEHNEYVIQEVETKDSLYRIPLAAIDSIGFQQPEFKYNPRLKKMDDLGMTPYVTYVNHEARILNFKGLPANLIPTEGDVLVGFDENVYGEGGFGGKVTQVDNQGGSVQVQLEKLSGFSDVFEQFITVEQLGTDSEGNLCRRLAGYHPQTRAEEGSDNKSLFDFAITVKRDWEPKKDVVISLSAEMGLKVDMKVSYYIDLDRVFVKFATTYAIVTKPSIGIQAKAEFDEPIFNLPSFLKKIRFPGTCPLFCTEPFPEFFIRGGGYLGANLEFPAIDFGMTANLVIDSELPGYPMRFFLSRRDPNENANRDFIDTGSASISLSGFLQTGVKFSLNLSSIDWIEDLFYSRIVMDVYAGPKVSGNFTYKTPTSEFDKFNFYSNFKESKLDASLFSLDMSAKALCGFFWYDPVERTFLEKSFPFLCDTLFIVPDFEPTIAKYDTEKGELKVDVRARKKVFIPNLLGIRLNDYENEPVTTVWDTSNYIFLTPPRSKRDFSYTFSNLKAGRYTVYPMTMIAGQEIPVNEFKEEVIVAPMLSLGPDTLVNVDGNAHEDQILFESNVAKAEDIMAYPVYEEYGVSTVMSADGWIHAEIVDFDPGRKYGYVKYTVDENKSIFSREGKISITATGAGYETTKTIRIVQAAGGTVKRVQLSVSYTIPEEYKDLKFFYLHEIGSLDYIPVSQSRDGDILTIEGTYMGKYPGMGSDSDQKNEQNLRFQLIADLNPKNPRIISGTLSNHIKYLSEKHEDDGYRKSDDIYRYNVDAEVAFEDVKLSPGAFSCFYFFSNEDNSGVNFLNGYIDYYYNWRLEIRAYDGPHVSTQTETAQFPLAMDLSPYIWIAFDYSE